MARRIYYDFRYGKRQKRKTEKMLAFLGAICYNKYVKRLMKKLDSDPEMEPQLTIKSARETSSVTAQQPAGKVRC